MKNFSGRLIYASVPSFVLFIILFFAAAYFPLHAQAPASSDQAGAIAQSAPDKARMEQVIQSFVSNKQFMGSVLVARGNDIVLDKGYGFADLEWDVPNSPTTKFRLGSVTKQFTAASILLLEERGKLIVNDPLKKYMADAPAAWDKITIFDLLTHTSGIPNFTSFPDYAYKEPFPATPEQLVARFRDKPLDFEPGEKWSYSNSGYVLLGYLIEKVSGETYAKFVQENIFTPLGMKDSGYDSNSAIISRRASGYVPSVSGPLNAGFIDMTVPLSAGALYSTTHDLLRWEQGLFGGKLLSAASLQKMTTPFKSDYAFGLLVHTVGGHKVIDHGGGIEGFNTHLTYYPDDKVTVVVLGNLNGQAPDDIAARLGSIALGEKIVLASERKEVTVDPKLFDSYIGSYQLAPTFILTVTREGDQLFVQATGQAKFEVFPESIRDYFYKAVDAQISFVTDGQGRATELILHQGGLDRHAKRMEADAPKPKEHKEVAVDPKLFDGYAGSYQLAPNFILTVTREGDHLFVQATGQPKAEVFPEGDRDFFYKVVEAQITFVADGQGKATELILHQGGDHSAKRLP
jgi:CubicO group peptidase (beta-lactamase class C family)